MRKPYDPRGRAKQAIEAMDEQPGSEWTPQQLSDVLGIHKRDVANTMKPLVAHEMAFVQRRGHRQTVYAREAFAEPAVEAVPFNAALWTDGDLVLYGLEECEGGAFKVAAANVPALKRLLGGVVA
jgi:hypothetical protein